MSGIYSIFTRPWPLGQANRVMVWMCLSVCLHVCLSPYIFKAWALWADAFYKSKCPSVCVFVRPSVCLFTFEVPFNGLFALLPKVGCQIFLEIRNPWGKVMERSGTNI